MSPDPTPASAREASKHESPTLTIQVTGGIGFGPTKLAAFDSALRQAGIADFNLVPLSSMVPMGSTIVASEGGAVPSGAWGDRLYVVMAQLRVDTRHEEAVAGLGWTQEPTTGRGVFVEHVGHTEREVRRDILSTLDSLAAGRPDIEFGAPGLMIRNTVCAGEPTCALVAAVFESVPWEGDTEIDLT
ncbi:MAG TPA: pyruvoyl-dependent arginine decarboxylase [Acidimicrobiia bacterium]|nr:pyruvoyl-dependent arginine decarboxylase [Acidimicrobiia bacterium]